MPSSVSNKSIWNIAYPIILGNLAQTIITFTDTAFLGHVGAIELGASMMAGIYYFVFATLAWGFSIGIQIIIARRLGEGRLERIGVVFGHGLFVVMFLSLLMFLCLHLFTSQLLRNIIDSPNIYAAAIQYMKYRHYGIIFVCFNFLFRSLYVGLSDTRPITYSTLLMAVVNISLDYGLIFGKFGFPEMGIGGAALASVCAEIAALIFFIIFTIAKLPLKRYSLFAFHKIEGWLMKEILKLALPTMLQRLISFGLWFVFFAMIESMGEMPIAVSGVVRSVYMLMTVPVFAFAATANTITSRIIGEGKQTEVMPTLFKILKNSLFLVIPLALICAFIPEYVIQIYTNDASLITACIPVLYVLCVAAVFMAFGMVFFEAVSGTGNTTAALLMELAVLGVYMLYIWYMTHIAKADIQWVWTAELVYGAAIGYVSWLFLHKANWQEKRI
jgi:putative MATE family efflux protein